VRWRSDNRNARNADNLLVASFRLSGWWKEETKQRIADREREREVKVVSMSMMLALRCLARRGVRFVEGYPRRLAPVSCSTSTTRSSRSYPALPQVTVGVVVLRRRREEEGTTMEAALVERKNEPAKNTFAFPGGRLDLGESLEDCARREVKEETNLDLCGSFPLQHVTTIDHVSRDEEGRVKYHYVIVEFVGLAEGEPVPGDDAASIDWATLKEIDSKNILDKKAHKDVLEKAIEVYSRETGRRREQ